MIRVFFDESGIHDAAKAVTSGVVWATADAWSKWTFDWSIQKRPIKVFHASECHNFKGEFVGWTREDRDNYVIGLLPLIRRHEIYGRISGCDRQTLVRSLRERPDVARWMENPYYPAFLFALRRAWDCLEAAGHREIAFVHEVNDYQDGILDHFDIERRRRPGCFATFSFGAKEEYEPLQCADILAYEGFRQLGDPEKPLRKPLEAIDGGSGRFAFIKFSPAETEGMAKHLIRSFDELYESEGVRRP